MAKALPLYNFKILLLGEPAVGKTAIVQRFIHSKFTKEYLLTIGVEPYLKYGKIRKKNIAWTIFDVAGQQRFNTMRTMFYRGAKGTFIVFDLTRRETFDNVEMWLDDVKKITPKQEYVLIGNKADLTNQRAIEADEGKKLAKKLGFVEYIETSALTGVKVDESFNYIGTKLFDIEEKKKMKR